MGDPNLVTVSLDNTLPTDDFAAGTGTFLSNYDLPDEATGDGAITEAPLTVTADNQSMVYDGEVFPVGDYIVSYDGFVNRRNISSSWRSTRLFHR
ncbi:MAG: hypothetical protein U5Q03_11840 [Bacteroidota bacterium]|nr:hypothetical protein [Bacteroidota bacterium]